MEHTLSRSSDFLFWGEAVLCGKTHTQQVLEKRKQSLAYT